MSGITGVLEQESRSDKAQWQSALNAMASSIYHRGPDAGGSWCDVRAGVGLAHRLLAVRGFSKGLEQPAWSTNGRYCAVLDGEISNCSELGPELARAGVRFCKGSDVEVVLEAISAWGLERALQRLKGAFAFALWDTHERCLHLARDRIGVKPLYYSQSGRYFLFGSELKALRAHPVWSGEVCHHSLGQLLRYGYIQEPRSIYRGVYKLPPGTCLSLKAGMLSTANVFLPGGKHGPQAYWAARTMAKAGREDGWAGTAEEAVDALEDKLQQIILPQLTMSDSVGAFLSGGIDSSLVTAIAQSQSRQSIHTFAIGFDEPSFNEAGHAKAVARHLGTDHHELYISPQDVRDTVPCLPQIYDEPFADPSQIPMIMACRLAKGHVAVALSGDGGDELFAGYNRYLWTEKVWAYRNSIPSILRNSIAATLTAVPAAYLNRLFELLFRVLPTTALQQPNLGGKLHKFAAGLRADSAMDLYRMLLSYWQELDQIMPGVSELHADARPGEMLAETLIDDLLFWDLTDYLPGGNLVKVDRAAMSTGLKLCLPLLDQRLVEFSWRIPTDLKLKEGQSKWLLRQLAYRHIPRKLLERPKMGFSPPVSNWLRGPLRDWGEDLLGLDRLTRQGVFVPEAIRKTWGDHLSGRCDAALPLWSMLMFQSWSDEQESALAGLKKSMPAIEHEHVFSDGAAAISSG